LDSRPGSRRVPQPRRAPADRAGLRRDPRLAPRAYRLRLAPRAAARRDAPPDGRGTPSQDETDGDPDQHFPRPRRRREGSGPSVEGRRHRRRRVGCVRARTRGRARVARARQRRAAAAHRVGIGPHANEDGRARRREHSRLHRRQAAARSGSLMATATSVPSQERLSISSDGETIQADLYGRLPATRVAILVHGQNWDASGWRGVAPLFAARGVPALAVNLRGYAGSTGKTNRYRPDKPWTPVADLRAAKGALRGRGVKEIALVGSSMGGSVVLASSFEGDVECVAAIYDPAAAVPDELSK